MKKSAIITIILIVVILIISIFLFSNLLQKENPRDKYKNDPNTILAPWESPDIYQNIRWIPDKNSISYVGAEDYDNIERLGFNPSVNSNLVLFEKDVNYYNEKISEIRRDIQYPCTDIIGNNLIYFKWEEIEKNGHYADKVDFKIYSLDLTKQNPFYEELTDQLIIKEFEDIKIKQWSKCYKWKSEFYSDCEISQKILSIYSPKTNNLYEIKGDKKEFGGGWFDSWSKVIESGDLEPLPNIEEVKISQNKIIWADKRNEKCIDEIGCDENTDIYILQIKE